MAQALKHRIPVRAHAVNDLTILKRTLKASEGELAYLLDTTPRTVYRWIEDGPPEHYDLLQHWKELIALAKKSMREEALAEWFREPNRALGGSIPIRLAADPRGFILVYTLLGNAANGNPL